MSRVATPPTQPSIIGGLPGDEAFHRFVVLYIYYVRSLVCRWHERYALLEQPDAIVTEVFLRVRQHFERHPGHCFASGCFRRWLVVVIHHLIVEYLRLQNRQHDQAASGVLDELPARDEATQPEAVQAYVHGLLNLARTEVESGRLHPDALRVVEARFLANRAVEDIAKELNCKKSTVYNRITEFRRWYECLPPEDRWE